MSRMRSSRCSSQARATCEGVAPCLAATRAIAGSSASFCGPPVKALPSGKKGTKASPRSRQASSTSSLERSSTEYWFCTLATATSSSASLDVRARDVRQADELELALPAQVVQRAEHLGQRRDAAGARLVVEQAQVDERQPLDVERAEVVLDAGAQLVGAQRGQPAALLVAARADLRHEAQAVGVGVQRLADELVDDVRPVVLRRVDVVDAELDGAAQDGERGVAVARRAEDAGAGELHRAESDPAGRRGCRAWR